MKKTLLTSCLILVPGASRLSGDLVDRYAQRRPDIAENSIVQSVHYCETPTIKDKCLKGVSVDI